MKQIGFKNFRKFKELRPMNLAPITIFVGENNAGKSTVVKGILALSDFLNNNRIIDDATILAYDRDDNIKEINKKLLKHINFYFNTSYLAHIGTFKRAIYNKADNDTITFCTELGYLGVTVNVKGNKRDEESISGHVSSININMSHFNIDMFFDIEADKAILTFNHKPKEIEPRGLSKALSERQKEFFQQLDHDVSYETSITGNWYPMRSNLIYSFINLIERAVGATLYKELQTDSDNSPSYYDYEGQPFIGVSEDNLDTLRELMTLVSPRLKNLDARRRFDFFPSLYGRLARMADIEYLYAHAVTQTVIYSAKDTNDYLSRTIHEFAPHQKDSFKKNFILKWMKQFGIGVDFTIRSVGGEAHVVYIKNHDEEMVNLADKGMGSIQLMVLLFRLAITLPRKGALRPLGVANKVVIIEEPEQNLHPMLQSKLADLLYEINRDYNFRFIVETHSEYLVRRSQVLVADNYKKAENLSEEWINPFRVFYFPADGCPYDMEYAKDGYFEKPFGTGFFNVSSELSLDLDRIEQGTYDEVQN